MIKKRIFTWVWGWASLHMLIPLSGVSILHPLPALDANHCSEKFVLKTQSLCWYQSQSSKRRRNEFTEWPQSHVISEWHKWCLQKQTHMRGPGKMRGWRGEIRLNLKTEMFPGWWTITLKRFTSTYSQKNRSHMGLAQIWLGCGLDLKCVGCRTKTGACCCCYCMPRPGQPIWQLQCAGATWTWSALLPNSLNMGGQGEGQSGGLGREGFGWRWY